MQKRFNQVKYRLVSINLNVTMKITAVNDDTEKDHMSLFCPLLVIKESSKMNNGTMKTTTECSTPKKSHSRKVGILNITDLYPI
jgi:hypothetical protein